MASFQVLTFNIWGLWLVSKKREERVRYLASYLKTCTADVVLLQEVWVDSDAQQLIRSAKAAGLQQCTHFRSGIFGSGLVTLSRHPIVEHGFWQYAASGFPMAIHCGDFYAKKGVGWVRLAGPQGEIDVFNTHLHSNYCHEYLPQPPAYLQRSANQEGCWAGAPMPTDDDAATRIAQLLELTQIIQLVSGTSSRPMLLGGDLNCVPDTLEMDLLRLRLPWLSDAWVSTHQWLRGSSGGGSSSSSSDGASADPPQQQPQQQQQQQQPERERLIGAPPASGEGRLLLGHEEEDANVNPQGFTCKAPGNSFSPKRQVPERIDYIWTDIGVSKVQLVLQKTPGGFSYSDHFAVFAELEWPAEAGGAVAGPKSLTLPPAGSGGSPVPGSSAIGSRLAVSARRAAAAAAAAAGGGGGAAAGVKAEGEGSRMSQARQQATAMGAAMLLEQGIQTFTGTGGTTLAVSGGLLTSLVYSGVLLPFVWDGLALRGPYFTLVILLTVFFTALGLCGVLMGLEGDKSQRRALQNAYRQIHVYMMHRGLAPHVAKPASSSQA